MTRHLLRLVWNRRRHNALLTVEIFFSFLVLFAVTLLAINFANNWRQPLGFAYERVWAIAVSPIDNSDEARAANAAVVQRLLDALGDLPAVERTAAMWTPPFSNSTWGGDINLRDGREIEFSRNLVTDDIARALELDVVSGRWFSAEDDGAAIEPVVLTRQAADALFGAVNPIGQIIPEKTGPQPNGETVEEKRVVGVIEAYRDKGELATTEPYIFHRARLRGATAEELGSGVRVQTLMIKVRPGTTAAAERNVLAALTAVADDWQFTIEPLDAMRHDKLMMYVTLLGVSGIIAVFLLMMVALGLTGVVWQSVTERTREFGLRRAKGATAANVQIQVLAELSIMTSVALLLGVLLVLQLPALPLPPDIWVFPSAVFAGSLAASVLVIYGLTLLCGWYPSRMTTRIHPAEALHFE